MSESKGDHVDAEEVQPELAELTPATQIGTKYSTTSSVYAEHTLSNPHNDQVLYCIGAVLQAQIFDDHEASHLQKDAFPEFNIDVELSPEYGGSVETIPEHILNHEGMHDNELKEKLVAGIVPTVDTIYRFTAMLNFTAKYSAQCNIIALIYLNRITGKNKFALTMQNWRGLWTAAIILAQKVWDDKPLRTSSFTQILPNVTKMQLRTLEFKAFVLLDYTAQVKPSVYAKYYFELRSLFTEITANDPRFLWALKPLSATQGMRLEDRSARAGHGLKTSTSASTNSPPQSKQAASDDMMSPSKAKPASSLTDSVSSAHSPAFSRGAKSATHSQTKTYEDVTYTPKSIYVLRL